MKRSILCLFMTAAIVFAGCQNSSDEFLAYEDNNEAAGHSIDTRVSQGDFFAEDLAVVSEEDNKGGDELLNSGSTLLINITDQKVQFADHVFDRMYPASLTKLLTALVVLNHGELTDSVTVSYDASHIAEPGARVCGYEEGDVISMEALMSSLLIYSANDAAVAIADHISGSEEEFAKLMNEDASKAGAVHSNFVNASGLHDDNQYTTAYDMYLIFNALLKYDTFRNIISSAAYTAVYQDKDGNELKKSFNSTNSFLNAADDDQTVQILGGLTGATSKAGNCCILLCKDSNNKEYISIILKAADSETLHSQTTLLLSYAAVK